MPYGLDIVIVNWNAGPQLAACIRSIAAAATDEVGLQRVTVVDNASTDGSADGLEALSPAVDVVRNAENAGFGVACNAGAARGSASFLLFLNPDTELYANSLVPALRRLAGDPAVGIVGIPLVDERGTPHRTCSRFPRLIHHVGKAFGLDRLGLVQSQFMTEWDHRSTRTVDHVMGAFYLIRRELFERLGGFDDRFFLYAEDLDLSLRARKLGFTSLFLAEGSAFHEGGGTSKQVKARRLFLSLKSRLIYSAKNDPPPVARLVWLLTMLVEPVTRTLDALVARDRRRFLEVREGYRLLWRDRHTLPSETGHPR